jgi:beta-glucosidase
MQDFIMLSPQTLVGALLLSAVPSALAETCQAPINHPGEPYSYVQPRNTTILADGHSPAVFPSRE